MVSPHPVPSDWIPSGLVDHGTTCLLHEILVRAAKATGAANTALWLAGEENLSATLGTGPHADQFIGKYKQPLDRGIISLVHASAQPVCENAIADNPAHSTILDDKLGIHTDAMIAVPVAVLGEIRGVVTCVHTRQAGSSDSPAEFQSADLVEFEFAAACIGRILEAAVLAETP